MADVMKMTNATHMVSLMKKLTTSTIIEGIILSREHTHHNGETTKILGERQSWEWIKSSHAISTTILKSTLEITTTITYK